MSSFVCNGHPVSGHREIERKFLVRDFSFLAYATRAYAIRQGYFAHENGNSVRVRLCDGEAFLTLKGPSADGMSRFEWEREIPVADAGEMLAFCHGGIIDKTRHIVPLDGLHVVEVDVFHGDNEGLVLAEIELQSETDALLLPDWLAEEVTGNPRYYNAYLTLHPFSRWQQDPPATPAK